MITIVDYDKKKKIVEGFYKKSIDILDFISDIISGIRYVNDYNLLDEYTDEKEKKDIELFGFSKREQINGRKEILLKELGNAGEFAIKYILCLKQMEDYPNQSYEQFKKKALHNICDKNVGEDYYVRDYSFPQAIVDNIRSEKNANYKLQPLHDFSYLIYVLKKIYPDLSEAIYESFIANIKSLHFNELNIDNDMRVIMACFPQCEWMPSAEISSDERITYIDEYKRVIRDSGDVFARLRYVENNEDNKQYDFASVYYYLTYLTFHIKLIHDYMNNNPNENIILAYNKNRFSTLADYYVSKKYKNNHDFKKGEHIKEYEAEHQRMDMVFEIIGKYYNQIISSFDYSQVRIYEELTGKKIDFIEMYENITNNILAFEIFPQLFGKIPVLLDAKKIQMY